MDVLGKWQNPHIGPTCRVTTIVIGMSSSSLRNCLLYPGKIVSDKHYYILEGMAEVSATLNLKDAWLVVLILSPFILRLASDKTG